VLSKKRMDSCRCRHKIVEVASGKWMHCYVDPCFGELKMVQRCNKRMCGCQDPKPDDFKKVMKTLVHGKLYRLKADYLMDWGVKGFQGTVPRGRVILFQEFNNDTARFHIPAFHEGKRVNKSVERLWKKTGATLRLTKDEVLRLLEEVE
jgi:hypothetical protein